MKTIAKFVVAITFYFAIINPARADFILCENLSNQGTSTSEKQICIDAHIDAAQLSGQGFSSQTYKDAITGNEIAFIKRRSMLPVRCGGYRAPTLTIQCEDGRAQTYILHSCSIFAEFRNQNRNADIKFENSQPEVASLQSVKFDRIEFADSQQLVVDMLANKSWTVRYYPVEDIGMTVKFMLNGQFTNELTKAIEPYREICGL